MITPVSFELSKLLKEKGFNQKCLHHYSKYTSNKEELKVGNTTWLQFVDWNDVKSALTNYTLYSAPTIAEVVMWLYEKNGIWISVIDVSPSHILWEYQISKKEVGLIHSSGQYTAQHNYLPTEAYESAIEYTLKNLI